MLSGAPDSTARHIDRDGRLTTGALELVYRMLPPFELEVRMPCFAVAMDERGPAALGAGNGSQLLASAGDEWRARLAQGSRYSVPEAVVGDAVRASLYHLLGGSLVAREEGLVVLGGPFLYRQFYMRDASFAAVALDRYGLHAEARGVLDYMLTQQTVAGELASHYDQQDGSGQALWALGEHLELTRDQAFAVASMGRVGQAVDWLRAAIGSFAGVTVNGRAESDSLYPGLLPSSTMADAEQLMGAHNVGHNLWASAGLVGALQTAAVAGDADSLAAWSELSREYRTTIERQLHELKARTGGLITPAFEGMFAQAGFAGAYGVRGGLDWGNLGVVFPTGFWRGDDLRLRSDIDAWRGRLKNGLYPYPLGGSTRLYHHYLTTSVAHTLLESRSDEDLGELFAILYDGLLGHTTAMLGGTELIDTRIRDVWPHDNTSPHNTFSSRYLILARDLLLSELGDTLVVGAGISPAWLSAGDRLVLTDTATRFGWASLEIEVAGAGAIADSTVNLAVKLSVVDQPPARFARSHAYFPAPSLPVRTGRPATRLGAVLFRAPLGFRVVDVRDLEEEPVGAVGAGGRGVVLTPAQASHFAVELRGARDPRWSAAAAKARLALPISSPHR
jgi:hypothetical protein